jgi:hypothetical protein
MHNQEQQFKLSFPGDYVRVTCSGILNKNAYLDLITLLQDGAAKWNGITRYFVDIRGAIHNISVLEQYELAVIAAEKWANFRAVTLVKSDMVLTGLYENTANNRGLKTLVTGDEAQALEWLLVGLEKPKP